MSDIDITLTLPEDLVERARTEGVLNDRRIALLLEAEVDRIQRWRALDAALEPAREAFRAEHPNMTEEEAMEFFNDIIHEVRREKQRKDQSENKNADP